MRRLVVLGSKQSIRQTRTDRVDNRFGNHPDVLAAGLLPWTPVKSGIKVQDHDLTRKQHIEDRLAGGEGDRA